jgi:hypothetical protein
MAGYGPWPKPRPPRRPLARGAAVHGESAAPAVGWRGERRVIPEELEAAGRVCGCGFVEEQPRAQARRQEEARPAAIRRRKYSTLPYS